MPCGASTSLSPILIPCSRSYAVLPDERGPADGAPDDVEDLLVARVGAQPAQVVGQSADGRGVGTAVVVDHDHQRQVVGRGDVVQRLPGHAAGQRAVADERDDRARPVLQPQGLGQAVGVRQRGRGVRVGDPVVLGLGRARISGQSAALPQGREPVLPAGEDLVHVALVPGVEDHRIARGLEDPVQRDGQLDDAEVGSEVAAGLAHVLDQEAADLLGQLAELLRAPCARRSCGLRTVLSSRYAVAGMGASLRAPSGRPPPRGYASPRSRNSCEQRAGVGAGRLGRRVVGHQRPDVADDGGDPDPDVADHPVLGLRSCGAARPAPSGR